MKLLLFYRPNAEYASTVEQYIKEFTQLHPEHTIDIINIDSAAANPQLEAYDIVQYPAILAVDQDGKEAKRWIGMPMPLMDDVLGYLLS